MTQEPPVHGEPPEVLLNNFRSKSVRNGKGDPLPGKFKLSNRAFKNNSESKWANVLAGAGSVKSSAGT